MANATTVLPPLQQPAMIVPAPDSSSRSPKKAMDVQTLATATPKAPPPITSIAAILSPQSPPPSPGRLPGQETRPRKHSYSRPMHPRLQCPHCNDAPEGFRSEHELRRHTNRIHKETRKVWVTIDTSPDKKFLANCKACVSGKKYNECYNAASHLRRMHFHPRKRGEVNDRKGGRGAGSGRSFDPPMEVLKRDWLREVEEVVWKKGTGMTGPTDDQDDDQNMDQDKDESSLSSSADSPRDHERSPPPGERHNYSIPPTPVSAEPSASSFAASSSSSLASPLDNADSNRMEVDS